MIFYILVTLMGMFFVLLEGTWLNGLPLNVIHFDLVIECIAAFSFLYKWKKALPLIIIYGFLADATQAAPFGSAVFSYLCVYAFIRAIIANISFNVGFGLFFWVAMISMLDKFVTAIVAAVAAGDMTVSYIMLKRAPMQVVFDGIVALAFVPFIFWLLSISWEKLTKPKGIVLK